MVGDMPQRLASDVREALRIVIDPEPGENVVDLGLIYRVTAGDAGEVAIDRTRSRPPPRAWPESSARRCASSTSGRGVPT